MKKAKMTKRAAVALASEIITLCFLFGLTPLLGDSKYPRLIYVGMASVISAIVALILVNADFKKPQRDRSGMVDVIFASAGVTLLLSILFIWVIHGLGSGH